MSDKPHLNYVNGNRVYIHGGFDDTIIENVIPYLYNLIDQQSNLKNGKIVFSINSVGGRSDTLRSLLSLIEQAKEKKVIIETYVESVAYSCGSVLAMSGTKGYRYIAIWGSHLIHYGLAYASGRTPTNFQRDVEHATFYKNIDKELYLYYTKLTLDQVNKLMEQDSSYLYADECIKYGLADKLIGDKNMVTQISSNIL